MSISGEIARILGNIASSYAEVSGKGGTLPPTRNSANLPAAIASIPSGGGGKGGDYDIIQTINGQNCSLAIRDANAFTLQEKTVTLAESGTVAVTPDAGYDGLSQVIINVVLGEARIGDVYYDTLTQAILAAQAGQTVTLLKNVALTTTLTVNKYLTIDLNGKALTFPSTGNSITVTGATLTINNGTLVGGTVSGCGLYANGNSAVINVNDVTCQGYCALAVSGGGKINVYGGSITTTYLYWADYNANNAITIIHATIANTDIYPDAGASDLGDKLIIIP